MPRRSERPLELLMRFPWWVSFLCFVGAFVTFRFIVPNLLAQHPVGRSLAIAIHQLSWLAFVFLFTAAASAWNSKRKRDLLDHQDGVESIRALSWREFEELLGETYRRQGYSVDENSSAGPDGGVDLLIRRGTERVLVQCKQWRASKVNVRVVREMYGLLHAENATGAIIVTSGTFTQEAHNFAAGKPVELIDGDQLVRLVGAVRNSQIVCSQSTPGANVSSPCPVCGNDMVLRTARRGGNAGTQFWGCSSYPQCRYTTDFE